jgi:hypothetical protein
MAAAGHLTGVMSLQAHKVVRRRSIRGHEKMRLTACCIEQACQHHKVLRCSYVGASRSLTVDPTFGTRAPLLQIRTLITSDLWLMIPWGLC